MRYSGVRVGSKGCSVYIPIVEYSSVDIVESQLQQRSAESPLWKKKPGGESPKGIFQPHATYSMQGLPALDVLAPVSSLKCRPGTTLVRWSRLRKG